MANPKTTITITIIVQIKVHQYLLKDKVIQQEYHLIINKSPYISTKCDLTRSRNGGIIFIQPTIVRISITSMEYHGISRGTFCG